MPTPNDVESAIDKLWKRKFLQTADVDEALYALTPPTKEET